MKTLILKLTAVVFWTAFSANAQWKVKKIDSSLGEQNSVYATVERKDYGTLMIYKNSNPLSPTFGRTQLILFKNPHFYDKHNPVSATIEFVVDGEVKCSSSNPYKNYLVRVSDSENFFGYVISADMLEDVNGWFLSDFKKASGVKITITDSQGTSFYTFNIKGGGEAFKEVYNQKSEKGTIITEEMYNKF